ncbi:MAG TPA: hypothetical protein VGM77_02815 [Gemmatimonadales bacterium]|jgi:uncharacterized membrane protein
MTATTPRGTAQTWAIIDEEKRRDRFVRRVSIIAWAGTAVCVLLLGVAYAISVVQMIKLMGVGLLSGFAILAAATRVLIALGLISLLIATLATIGTFLRMRTTSLAEIQLRLAALEEMITARGDGQAGE